MTIEATNVYSGPYYPNGVTTVFPFNFQVADASEVGINIDGATVDTSLFNVTLSGDGTGAATFFTAPTGSVLVVFSNPAFTQKTNFEDQGPYYQSALNNPLDRSAIRDLILLDGLNRSVRLPIGETMAQLPAASARAGKYPYFAAGSGALTVVEGAGAAATVADAVGADDGAGGTLFGNVQEFIDGIIGLGNSGPIVVSVTFAQLPAVRPVSGRIVYMTDSGKEGAWKCFPGTQPSADLWGGIYRASNTTGFYWSRIWDGVNVRAEWFGHVYDDPTAAASNDVRLRAAYAFGPKTHLRGGVSWISTTFKANLEHRSLYGIGCEYSDSDPNGATRLLMNDGSQNILQHGPDAYPGSVNALPQGIYIEDIYVGRTVAPAISSGCIGVLSRWVLYGGLKNIRSVESMVGFRRNGVVHLTVENCDAERSTAGTGAGADYFYGHDEDGSGGLAAGGNASLYITKCIAACNYGPLQTSSQSVGFRANGGFTDTFYSEPETVNFPIAQGIYGLNASGISFSNTDLIVRHPIHDQFHNIGIYINATSLSGSAEIENPYLGPSVDARACLWLNASLAAVSTRGGQWVMGVAPNTQPIIIEQSRSCNILGYPTILEAGATYPIVGIINTSDAIVEVHAHNPNQSSDTVVSIAGSCDNLYVSPKCTGKASAFNYGIKTSGTAVTRSTFDVSRLSTSSLVSASAKFDFNGTAITTAGYVPTSATNLGQGNFN